MSGAAYALGAIALAICLTCNHAFAQSPPSAAPGQAATDNIRAATENSSPDKKMKMQMMTDCTKQAKKQKLNFAKSQTFMKECMSGADRRFLKK